MFAAAEKKHTTEHLKLLPPTTKLFFRILPHMRKHRCTHPLAIRACNHMQSDPALANREQVLQGEFI